MNTSTARRAPRPTSATRRAALLPKRAPDAGASGADAAVPEPALDVRERILGTASTLFYERGVRAVGVDLVVLEAAVAKTSLYRYFPTKDDLIVAFLEREDLDFWLQWDRVAAQWANDPAGELDAHMHWIGERLARSNYRGCPQINVAAEFAEQDHPARQVAARHMEAMRTRLQDLATRLNVPRPRQLGAQLAVLVNGAFVSSGLLRPEEATDVLQGAVQSLLAGAQADA